MSSKDYYDRRTKEYVIVLDDKEDSDLVTYLSNILREDRLKKEASRA